MDLRSATESLITYFERTDEDGLLTSDELRAAALDTSAELSPESRALAAQLSARGELHLHVSELANELRLGLVNATELSRNDLRAFVESLAPTTEVSATTPTVGGPTSLREPLHSALATGLGADDPLVAEITASGLNAETAAALADRVAELNGEIPLGAAMSNAERQAWSNRVILNSLIEHAGEPGNLSALRASSAVEQLRGLLTVAPDGAVVSLRHGLPFVPLGDGEENLVAGGLYQLTDRDIFPATLGPDGFVAASDERVARMPNLGDLVALHPAMRIRGFVMRNLFSGVTSSLRMGPSAAPALATANGGAVALNNGALVATAGTATLGLGANAVYMARGNRGTNRGGRTGPTVPRPTDQFFNHSFTRHGSQNTGALLERARRTGTPQGQWLEGQHRAVAELIHRVRSQMTAAQVRAGQPIRVEIPAGMGRVIMPNGEFVATRFIHIIPRAGRGIHSAFPVLP